MIAELKWQTLANRRRVTRLLMFYKIHYHLVTIDMSLSPDLHLQPTHTEYIAGMYHTIVKLGPHLTQYAWAEAYLHTKWHLDPQCTNITDREDRTDNGPIA